MKIAIIGAGISGSILYGKLKDTAQVTIFEKSRGAGGRVSTKYIDEYLIDHGTPFIKSKDIVSNEFKNFLTTLEKSNVLKNEEDSYYPLKGMNKVCSSLIDKKDLLRKTKIKSIVKINNKWTLEDDENKIYKEFDKVLITIPASQIKELDIKYNNSFLKSINYIKYESITTLICHTKDDLALDYKELKKIKNLEFIANIVDNSSKYSYKNFNSYVIYTNKKFTYNKNNLTKEEVGEILLKKITEKTKIDLKERFTVLPHLWKYALPKNYFSEEFFYTNDLGICGDYFEKYNLESAYNSSIKLANRILKEIN